MVNTQMNNINAFPKLMKIQWTNKKYIIHTRCYIILYMLYAITYATCYIIEKNSKIMLDKRESDYMGERMYFT